MVSLASREVRMVPAVREISPDLCRNRRLAASFVYQPSTESLSASCRIARPICDRPSRDKRDYNVVARSHGASCSLGDLRSEPPRVVVRARGGFPCHQAQRFGSQRKADEIRVAKCRFFHHCLRNSCAAPGIS